MGFFCDYCQNFLLLLHMEKEPPVVCKPSQKEGWTRPTDQLQTKEQMTGEMESHSLDAHMMHRNKSLVILGSLEVPVR